MRWAPLGRLQTIPELVRKLDTRMRQLLVALRKKEPNNCLFFYQDAVAASQTAVALAFGVPTVASFMMPRVGHVIGLGVYSDAARTAGTLTIEVLINGTAHATTAQLDGTNTTKHIVRIAKDLASAFAEGTPIGAQITTDGSWAPTTANIQVVVFVVFPMED